MGAPGHRDAELDAKARMGSGSEQPHAAAQSKIQGFGEASGCRLTRKHLPTQEEPSERDGPGPAAPQPGDRGIASWKAKFLLLRGNRAVSAQRCEGWGWGSSLPGSEGWSPSYPEQDTSRSPLQGNSQDLEPRLSSSRLQRQKEVSVQRKSIAHNGHAGLHQGLPAQGAAPRSLPPQPALPCRRMMALKVAPLQGWVKDPSPPVEGAPKRCRPGNTTGASNPTPAPCWRHGRVEQPASPPASLFD